MHHGNGKLRRVGVIAAVAAAIMGWASPAIAQVPSLALASQMEPPDPNSVATVLLLISIATVVAIKRKYPELGLFPLAPVSMPRRPGRRSRLRR
ncbi:MAG: hypothetical protein ACM359_12690 [Bacillota bacterium]